MMNESQGYFIYIGNHLKELQAFLKKHGPDKELGLICRRPEDANFAAPFEMILVETQDFPVGGSNFSWPEIVRACAEKGSIIWILVPDDTLSADIATLWGMAYAAGANGIMAYRRDLRRRSKRSRV